MAIISKTSVNKNEVSTFTLNKSELQLVESVVEDTYFADPTNWKRVKVHYKSSLGDQREVVVFDATQATPVGGFLVSEKARDEFLVRKITIEDFDGGYHTVTRDELNPSDFDVLFGVISGVISGAISLLGRNNSGQLGDGTSGDDSNTLVSPLVGFSDFTQIALGDGHSAALRENGEIWAWGANWLGQLGDGTTTPRLSPVKIVGQSDFKSVHINGSLNFTLALKSNGTLWFTGAGALSGANSANVSSMTQVTGHSDFKQIFAGYTGVVFGIKSDDTVWAWGQNSFGRLGNGTTSNVVTPTLRTDLSGFVQFHGFGFHTMGVKSDGTIWGTGLGSAGALGLGDEGSRDVFTQVIGHSNVKQVHCGNFYTYILKSDGVLWSTGQGFYLATGLGSTANTLNFTQITSTSDFKKITCAENSAIGLKSDGTLWGVGDGTYGAMLGLGFVTVSSFSLLTGGTDNDDIVAGFQHSGLIKKST
jgi:alpha-tubulin suppressor-like RCC1 family protein